MKLLADNTVVAAPAMAETSSHAHAATTVLAWIAVGAVLYVGKPALAPLLFAVVLALVLSPLVDTLQQWHLPRVLGAILSVGLLVGALGITVDLAWTPAQQWIKAAPATLQAVEQKVRPLQRFISRLDTVTTRATSLTTAAGNAQNKTVVVDASSSSAGLNTLNVTRVILIHVATVSILTVFLLIGGGRTLHSIEAVLARNGKPYHCLQLVDAVRGELSRYIATLTLINLVLGVVVAAMTALWGLPNPWLWGVIAAVLNFIPYLGPTITLTILTIVALVTFDGYGTAVGVGGSFLLIATLEGQVVQPLLMGARLNLNPIVLFVSIWLAGWFWGVAGVLLATPALIALKEVANKQASPGVLTALLAGRSR
jgi:predicted PurR-regulated permease PerM